MHSALAMLRVSVNEWDRLPVGQRAAAEERVERLFACATEIKVRHEIRFK
jgi:hypothetical protein